MTFKLYSKVCTVNMSGKYTAHFMFLLVLFFFLHVHREVKTGGGYFVQLPHVHPAVPRAMQAMVLHLGATRYIVNIKFTEKLNKAFCGKLFVFKGTLTAVVVGR